MRTKQFEYLWMILAALGAGIGTGLAGLSAATVMVPTLITLYPVFRERQVPIRQLRLHWLSA